MKLLDQAWVQAKWHEAGYQSPTPVQAALFDCIKVGQSLIAISPTGSGKTIAYLLPTMQAIEARAGLQLIVLAPSQELASQIAQVAQAWGTTLDLRVQLIVGGANVKRQEEDLKAKPEIIVATPGRLNELAQKSRKIKFHLVKFLVVDEADYLLEGDQVQALEAIEKRLMRDVSSIWVSATFGPALQAQAQKSPHYQVVDLTESVVSPQIMHHYLLVPDRQKVKQLKRLAQVAHMKAVIFFEQVHELEQVAAKLVYEKVPILVLHGGLTKQERVKALNLFGHSTAVYLLTTDVAARGIDFEAVPYVIHYNRVTSKETYVHRSGRTGRMGQAGQVLSLVNEQELRDLQEILKPLSLQLSQRFLYEGSLVSDLPQKLNNQTPTTAKSKTTKTKVSQANSSKPTIAKAKIKKKNRQRLTKNKGKRAKITQ